MLETIKYICFDYNPTAVDTGTKITDDNVKYQNLALLFLSLQGRIEVYAARHLQ